MGATDAPISRSRFNVIFSNEPVVEGKFCVDKTTRWEGCSLPGDLGRDFVKRKKKGSCVLEVAWDWDNELGWIGLDWIGALFDFAVRRERGEGKLGGGSGVQWSGGEQGWGAGERERSGKASCSLTRGNLTAERSISWSTVDGLHVTVRYQTCRARGRSARGRSFGSCVGVSGQR